MAALSTADRTRVWRGLMRYWSAQGETVAGILKTDLYNTSNNTGAIADTDSWIDGHSGNVSADTVGFNAALATVIKNNLTTAQKTLMFCAVALMRTGNVALLSDILGEVE